jgi:hypothetical protein
MCVSTCGQLVLHKAIHERHVARLKSIVNYYRSLSMLLFSLSLQSMLCIASIQFNDFIFQYRHQTIQHARRLILLCIISDDNKILFYYVIRIRIVMLLRFIDVQLRKLQ